MDAEKSHDFTLQCLKMTAHPLFYPLFKSLIDTPKGLSKTVMGINFSNLIGLAAGADKMVRQLMVSACWGWGLLKLVR